MRLLSLYAYIYRLCRYDRRLHERYKIVRRTTVDTVHPAQLLLCRIIEWEQTESVGSVLLLGINKRKRTLFVGKVLNVGCLFVCKVSPV